MRDLTYVYGIARAPLTVPRVAGVDGATVRLVSSDDLVALASTVPEEGFGEAALRERLEEMDTLEALARAHHTVIDAAAARAVVLPLRLATVYRGDERVAEMLERGRERFTEALERLMDRQEWGVKVYAEPGGSSGDGAGARPGGAAASGDASRLGSGKEYLRRRKAERRSAEETRRATAEFAGRVDAELGALAAGVRHYRPQNPRLSGADGENVLNAAYLVDADRADALAAAVRELNGSVPGTRVELTGPWAPYSFALPEPA